MFLTYNPARRKLDAQLSHFFLENNYCRRNFFLMIRIFFMGRLHFPGVKHPKLLQCSLMHAFVNIDILFKTHPMTSWNAYFRKELNEFWHLLQNNDEFSHARAGTKIKGLFICLSVSTKYQKYVFFIFTITFSPYMVP